ANRRVDLEQAREGLRRGIVRLLERSLLPNRVDQPLREAVLPTGRVTDLVDNENVEKATVLLSTRYRDDDRDPVLLLVALLERLLEQVADREAVRAASVRHDGHLGVRGDQP